MGAWKNQQELQAAIDRLADAIEYGHLLACSDPVSFINTVTAELTDLRDEIAKLRGVETKKPRPQERSRQTPQKRGT